MPCKCRRGPQRNGRIIQQITDSLTLRTMIPAFASLPRVLTTADYARAEQLMPYEIERLTLNTIDTPVWLASGKFCYRVRTRRGTTFQLVDPLQNTKRAAFNHQKLARALQRAGGGQHAADDLPLATVDFSSDELTVSFQIGIERWKWPTADGQCERLPALDPQAVVSPDGRREVFIKDHNLWMRDVIGGTETRLTADGVENFGYATDNSARRHTNRPVVLWSPDSKKIATFLQDQRGVGDMHLVRPQRGHPHLETWKYAMPRDATIPRVHRVIIDVDALRIVKLQMPPDFVRSASWLGLAHEHTGELEAQWSADANRLAFISISRDHKQARLRIADAGTGAVREVLEEQTTAFYESAPSFWHAMRSHRAPNWCCLYETNELLWYSSRDGWGHLYLYDLDSGRLKRQVTCGSWNVVTLLRVDEAARVAYFQAVGRERGRHPYFEHFYSIDLDGQQCVLLTPEDATHVVSMGNSGEFFVDSFSRPETPPVTVLRDLRGRLIRTLDKVDASGLTARGWRPPVSIMVKARDGTTDLHGLMFKPSDFNESHRYPIINAMYSCPILGSVIPRGAAAQWGSFCPTYGWLGDAHSLAELGFIVVMIDGMGTPLRSRTFHEALYGDYGDASLPDQVAGMKQLAQRHAWIDIERAGIYGVSAGGYAAARAMFVYPDFFKVAVAIAGNHDPSSYMDEFSEKFMGPFESHADGTTNYDAHANFGLARHLQGRLLLVHGMMDDNVPPYHTLLLVQELIESNKDFDLLMLPNQTHAVESGVVGRYLVRRHWDYFVRHLLGAEPPAQYGMRVPVAESVQPPEIIPTAQRRLAAQ